MYILIAPVLFEGMCPSYTVVASGSSHGIPRSEGVNIGPSVERTDNRNSSIRMDQVLTWGCASGARDLQGRGTMVF